MWMAGGGRGPALTPLSEVSHPVRSRGVDHAAITRGNMNVPTAMIGARVAAVLLSLDTAPLAGAAVLTRPS